MQKQVIALVGEPLAGKGVFSGVVTDWAGQEKVNQISTGDILRQVLTILNRSTDRLECDKLVAALIGGFGEGFLAQAVEREIHNSLSPFIIFDCMRLLEDEQVAIRLPYPTKRVYVTASPQVRYARLQIRKRGGEDATTFEQFMEQENLPTVRLTREIGQRANVIIDNSSTGEDFEKKVIEFCENYIER